MLEIRDLSSGYGETIVIENINLQVKKGEVVALIGKNGVGKTTLLKSVMGLIRKKRGQILFNGINLEKLKPEQRAVLGMAYVPQGREIFPFLTVKENLLLGIEARNNVEKEIPKDIYELFPDLKKIENRKGGDLSGGQQQQLAIARMLITRPKLIMLDEPTEGIQPSIVYAIENAIRMIKEQKTISIILVEQFVEFALRLADSCYIMEKGKIIFGDTIENLDKNEIKSRVGF
ncbi:MAG: urea ABC transporter ATP-binding subunit UrtE [Brevinematales bacterium]|nr:urea ABC transporter ATP-binding subunit UrtE [Brevinematales bacterium]